MARDNAKKKVWVKGYTKSDGTVVPEHLRSTPRTPDGPKKPEKQKKQ